ncbi:MAG: hypothetical protein RL133_104 [Pseudomonadota bacterium]
MSTSFRNLPGYSGLLALGLSALLAWPLPAHAANALRAGPMVGDADMHNVSIWLQTEQPGPVVLSYWPLEAPDQRREMSLATRDEGIATATIRIRGLKPGQTYAYQVSVDGKSGGVLQFKTQPRWQYRNGVQPPNFRLAMGSCAYINEPDKDRDGRPYGGDYQIFERMADAKPDLTLWLGDNVYFRENDYTSAEGMAHRYRHDRALPQLQRLLQTGRHHAIWDDHDYGPNNSNQSFTLKADALSLFQRYWANRSHGLPGHPGVYGNFMEGDVEFFLMDNRSFRDSDEDLRNPSKAQFGTEQMRWLKNALLASTATFKVIAAGGQFLNDYNRFEGWTHFKAERADFMEWLAANRVRGVVFLSGDRHHTELIRLPRHGHYPLYELTCSPLTAGASKGMGDEDKKSFLVPGTLVQQRNFCTIDFSGDRKARKMVLKSYNSDGTPLWTHEINESELR